jgi:hypothetical protein
MKKRRGRPQEPPEDVQKKQNPNHSEADFLRDLRKASRRLERPSEPGRGSPRR